MRHAMIMAGGAGTRLWPMSRQHRPKQLLPFIHGQSLLKLAVDRAAGLVSQEHVVICTGEKHRKVIQQTIPAIADNQILGEPVGRDTVNAIGFTASVLLKNDPDAIFAVLTADHLIEPIDEFQRKLDIGFQLVENDPHRLVTFSIRPTFPATGYGYVERGESIPEFDDAFVATRFVEKPNRETAEVYLDSGNFGWNSGMFVFSASMFMEAILQFLPENQEGLVNIGRVWGTAEQTAALQAIYPELKKISVDYAIMEPASRDDRLTVCTVNMNISWMDVGNWTSYGETLEPDQSGNRTNTKATHLDSRDVLAVSDDPNHTITTIDCKDLIVIHTKDATLICPRASAERVKEIAGKVDDSLR